MNKQIFDSTSKYKNVFFFDGNNKYLEELKLANKDVRIIKYEKSLKDFVSKENKKNLIAYIKNIEDDRKKEKAMDSPFNKIYIVEIWEDLNSSINSIDSIPNIKKYYKKLSKYISKHNNLFFVILNKVKVIEFLKNQSLNEEKRLKEMNEKIDEIVKQKEIELRHRIQKEFDDQKEVLDAQKHALELQRQRIEDEKKKIQEKEKIFQKETKNLKTLEEIKNISTEKKENVTGYSFDQSSNTRFPKKGKYDTDYDNIVWYNKDNQDLFKVKKSDTNFFSLDEISDPAFDRLIEENSNIETIRLETNQVKINFNDEKDYSKKSKTYHPYER